MFDVDGTLTPPKQTASPEFRKEFLKWIENKEVYLVSGGSFIRLCEQLGGDVMEGIAGVLACLGNVYSKNNRDESRAWFFGYEHKFTAPKKLCPTLAKISTASKYPVTTDEND